MCLLGKKSNKTNSNDHPGNSLFVAVVSEVVGQNNRPGKKKAHPSLTLPILLIF